MKRLIAGALPAALLALGACGGNTASASSDASDAATPSSSPAPPSPTATGYSDGCRLAALGWVNTATTASVGLLMATPDNDLTDKLTNGADKIHVKCGPGMLTNTSSTANYTMALVNTSVTVGGALAPGDTKKLDKVTAQIKKVRNAVQ